LLCGAHSQPFASNKTEQNENGTQQQQQQKKQLKRESEREFLRVTAAAATREQPRILINKFRSREAENCGGERAS
jgi:hypothetical protein